MLQRVSREYLKKVRLLELQHQESLIEVVRWHQLEILQELKLLE